jgi:hypothetical protein
MYFSKLETIYDIVIHKGCTWKLIKYYNIWTIINMKNRTCHYYKFEFYSFYFHKKISFSIVRQVPASYFGYVHSNSAQSQLNFSEYKKKLSTYHFPRIKSSIETTFLYLLFSKLMKSLQKILSVKQKRQKRRIWTWRKMLGLENRRKISRLLKLTISSIC